MVEFNSVATLHNAIEEAWGEVGMACAKYERERDDMTQLRMEQRAMEIGRLQGYAEGLEMAVREVGKDLSKAVSDSINCDFRRMYAIAGGKSVQDAFFENPK